MSEVTFVVVVMRRSLGPSAHTTGTTSLSASGTDRPRRRFISKSLGKSLGCYVFSASWKLVCSCIGTVPCSAIYVRPSSVAFLWADINV